MSDQEYLEKTIADVEAEIESLQSLVRGINRLIRERDSKLQKTTARVKPSTIEFTANDPIVTITGPAEPGVPPQSKGDKNPPIDAKPHIPPSLPEKKERGPYKKTDSKRRPMNRSRSMGTLQVGKQRASASSRGRDVTNVAPEDLPEIKRICKDCGESKPLSKFKGLFDSFARERCNSCQAKFNQPRR